MMRTSYDPTADAFYARFAPEGTEIAETKEVAPGVMIDIDATGHLVGVEVLGVAVRSSGAYGITPIRSAAE
jgi:uncharacterized protein YuzE